MALSFDWNAGVTMADLLSYEDVFGGSSGNGEGLLSYEDVFGSSKDQKSDASRTWGEVATDVGVTALKGAIGLPESLRVFPLPFQIRPQHD